VLASSCEYTEFTVTCPAAYAYGCRRNVLHLI